MLVKGAQVYRFFLVCVWKSKAFLVLEIVVWLLGKTFSGSRIRYEMVCILDYEGYGKLIFAGIRWKPSVVMMQTLSSPQVVVMTTYAYMVSWRQSWHHVHCRPNSDTVKAIDLILKSHNAPVLYPTVFHSEQKCAHFYSEWSIVGYGTGAFWDLWNWSILIKLSILRSRLLIFFNNLCIYDSQITTVLITLQCCLVFIGTFNVWSI